MYNFNLKHFNASHLMQLRNQETKAAFDQILGVFKNEEITIDYVAETFEDAKAESEKLVILRNMNKKHHLTKPITEQKHTRFDYFTVFTSTVTTALKSPYEEKRKAAQVLNEWLEPYRKSLSRPLLGVQTTLVDEISDEVDKVERVFDAVVTLNLINVLDSIKLITTDMIANMDTRHNERIEERRKAQILKRSAYAKLIIFLNSVEMVINMNGENKATYLNYAEKVNGYLDSYKATLLSRSTRFKTAAEKEQANSDKEGNNTDGDIITTNATSQSNGAMRSTPYNLASFDKVMDMDMDMQTKEKTNADSATTNALNGSEIKNGNGVFTNKAYGASAADDNTEALNGANRFDKESNNNE